MENSLFNYYDILEVNPHSAQPDITTAYERAKATYSGENPAIYTVFSEEEARDLLRLVEEAYQVLGNKTLRALYDEKLVQGNFKKEDVSFAALSNQSKAQFPQPQTKVPQKIEYSPNKEFESEITNCTQWTGSFLRKVREYKNVSLERMSEVTKISAYYIKSLEEMDPAGLPAPVFIRGYVSQVSKLLGLDEKKVCDSYMKLFKEKLESK